MTNMNKENLSESESDDDIKKPTTKDDLSSTSSGNLTDEKSQFLLKPPDLSNTSLNSGSAEFNEKLKEKYKKSLIHFRNNQLSSRRSSSPAVLEKIKTNNDYSTLRNHLKNCENDRVITIPEIPCIADATLMGLQHSDSIHSLKNNEEEEAIKKEKRLEKFRSFVLEHCMYKLFLSFPFGFLGTIGVLGLKANPLTFLCLIVIFTILVCYPIACLIWLLYKLLLPYYQLCRYSPTTEAAEKVSKGKEEGEAEFEVPAILLETPEPNKTLSQSVYEKRKMSYCRRPSSLPAIEEGKAEDDSSLSRKGETEEDERCEEHEKQEINNLEKGKCANTLDKNR